MKKYTLISAILKEGSYEETTLFFSQLHGYQEVGRKLTVVLLLRYFLLAAYLKSTGFRLLSLQGEQFGLPKVNYSTLSKKAADVPYTIFLDICNAVMQQANREKRRKYGPMYDRMLKVIDSTRITACASKWPWAPYMKESSGIKLHTAFSPETGLPTQLIPTEINVGDTAKLEDFRDPFYVLVGDRGYMNIARLCEFDSGDEKQEFVVRLRETVRLMNIKSRKVDEASVYEDLLCTLSKDRAVKKEHREHELRVVRFMGSNGHPVTLCTNIYDLTAGEIADIYRRRWAIECFFREFKQNFGVKKPFGRSMNAVFSQCVIAFIAYILTAFIHSNLVAKSRFRGVFTTFLRALDNNQLSCHLRSFSSAMIHL